MLLKQGANSMKYTKRLRKYIFKYKGRLFLGFLLGTLFSACDIIIPFLIGYIIDIFDEISYCSSFICSDSLIDSIIKILLIILSLVILLILFNYFFGIIISLTGERICKDIKNDLFQKINSMSIKDIDSKQKGDLVSRIINDVDYVNTAINGAFKQFYSGLITIIFTLIFTFVLNWMLALIVLILTPISFLVSYYVAKSCYNSFKEQSSLQGNMGAKILEDLNNIELIKSSNYENESIEKYEKMNAKLFVVGKKAQFASSLTNPSTRIINNIIYAIICIVGAILCVLAYYKDNNQILGATCTIGIITSFLQYANKFAKPFNEMSSCFGEIEQGIASFKRINEILEEKDDIDIGTTKLVNKVNNLSFENVSFSYDPSVPLIQNFSFNIKKGDHIALVGPTGCGKTTMINLIMRYYDPNSGSIKINGVDTQIIKKSSLRDKIGLVLQDSWIFKGTVFDNIKYSKPNATKEEVIEASKNANAYSFISKLPKGFDTIISDDSGLSNGQKQLITIARVMLKNPEIMILDEATSNIDTRSERKIIKAFNELTKNKTSFIIAHRLSTIVSSDAIIVMKDGHIIEVGKHEELLLKKGFYYELFNAQFDK